MTNNPKHSVQFAQSCPTLCDRMDYSTQGFSVHHHLLELVQTYVHQVGDVIQPPHFLSSPSPPAFNLAHSQGLFQWVSSSHQVDKGLEFQVWYQSFQWIFRTDFFWFFFFFDWLVWSPCSPSDSQESSPTPQFKSINSSVLSFLYSPTLTSLHGYWKIIDLTRWTSLSKTMSLLFNMLSKLVNSFSSKEQASFNFMAAVTICSDFGAHENKVCQCFHCLPIYWPWNDGIWCHDLHFLNVEF